MKAIRVLPLLLALALVSGACVDQHVRVEAQGGIDAADPPGLNVALRAALAEHFLVGAALNREQILGSDIASHDAIAEQFSALTAENSMKWEKLQPLEDVFYWDIADRLVEFAAANDMHVTGHALVWHQQTPDWVFEDDQGNPASRELLLSRMERHIKAVVGRYRGKVQSWDVVNEALSEDGSPRESKWRRIIGDDYIEKAFRFAHEADPDALLYYNDFNMYFPGKRAGAIRLVQYLLDRGVPIHGIGLQAHLELDQPRSIALIEESIVEYAALGLDVMLTELDVSVLPFPETSDGGAEITDRFAYEASLNPYVDGLPEDVQGRYTDFYTDLFEVLLRRSDNITRVTFWGVHDGQSWKNNWPVPGRTDYPLPFDRQNRPKPALLVVLDLLDAVDSQ